MIRYLQVPCQSCGPVKVPTDAVLIRHTTAGDRVEWTCSCGTSGAWRPHPAYRGYLQAHRVGVREVWENVPEEMADPVRQIETTRRTEERIDLLVDGYARRLARRDDLAEVAREQQEAIDEIRRRNTP